MIKQFNGNEGLLEITRNSLRTKGELLIYETSYASLNTFLDKEVADEIRRQFMQKKIRVRELTNTAYHDEYTGVPGYHRQVMDIRYIRPMRLTIKTEMLIYNDVVAYYSITENSWGVEIYDQRLADIQRQLFETLWSIAEKPIIGKNGRTSLI